MSGRCTAHKLTHTRSLTLFPTLYKLDATLLMKAVQYQFQAVTIYNPARRHRALKTGVTPFPLFLPSAGKHAGLTRPDAKEGAKE